MEHLPSYRDSLYADIQPSYRDSLTHHGIKGQKWGVRRYQNPDGSLTTQGKKRYSKSNSNSLQKKVVSNLQEKAAKKQLAVINNNAIHMHGDAGNLEWDFADKRKKAALDSAIDNMNDNPTRNNSNIVLKQAYEYGYDYGKKTGRSLVNKYGNAEVNRYIDTQVSYKPAKPMSNREALARLHNTDAVERYAKYRGVFEQRALSNDYGFVGIVPYDRTQLSKV